MPFLFVPLRNLDYCSRDEGAEFVGPEDARASGVQGAVSLAVDEIDRGRRSAAIVVNVEQEDGRRLLTSVVAVSVSPLMVVKVNSRNSS